MTTTVIRKGTDCVCQLTFFEQHASGIGHHLPFATTVLH